MVDYPSTAETTTAATCRKRSADAIGRIIAVTCQSDGGGVSTTAGRGVVAGWTFCPLCEGLSKKRFAIGRGIAAHLYAVHTPWNPGKLERKKRQQQRLAEDSNKIVKRQKIINNDEEEKISWDPSPEEMESWDRTVLRILADIESKAVEASSDSSKNPENGLDRNGAKSLSYRNSLPEFLQAAADGNLERIMEMVVQQQKCGDDDNDDETIRDLIDSRDRHGSLAEHWAAGGGHLDCLKYLLALREKIKDKTQESDSSTFTTITTKKLRRRDGKTCLHYAARNGHCHIIEFLLDVQKMNVNEPSGDGTTPVHMACFGGNMEAVKLLVEKGADVHAVNEWGCSTAHWVGMTKKDDDDDGQVKALCRFLQQMGVSFTETQKQGHCALHKAAQRLNKHVIEWMGESAENGGAGLTEEDRTKAARPDEGGHTARDIWCSMGGDEAFAKRMEHWGF